MRFICRVVCDRGVDWKLGQDFFSLERIRLDKALDEFLQRRDLAL